MTRGRVEASAAALGADRFVCIFVAREFAREGFTLSRENQLKRQPLGFPTDTPYASFLRLRDVLLERPLSDAELTAPDLTTRTLAAFASTAGFCRQLNRAVEYALEEE